MKNAIVIIMVLLFAGLLFVETADAQIFGRLFNRGYPAYGTASFSMQTMPQCMPQCMPPMPIGGYGGNCGSRASGVDLSDMVDLTFKVNLLRGVDRIGAGTESIAHSINLQTERLEEMEDSLDAIGENTAIAAVAQMQVEEHISQQVTEQARANSQPQPQPVIVVPQAPQSMLMPSVTPSVMPGPISHTNRVAAGSGNRAVQIYNASRRQYYPR